MGTQQAPLRRIQGGSPNSRGFNQRAQRTNRASNPNTVFNQRNGNQGGSSMDLRLQNTINQQRQQQQMGSALNNAQRNYPGQQQGGGAGAGTGWGYDAPQQRPGGGGGGWSPQPGGGWGSPNPAGNMSNISNLSWGQQQPSPGGWGGLQDALQRAQGQQPGAGGGSVGVDLRSLFGPDWGGGGWIPSGTGFPGGPPIGGGGGYNQRAPSNPYQQQDPNLGRYRPPTMNGNGSWNDEGGYNYNLPDSFGGRGHYGYNPFGMGFPGGGGMGFPGGNNPYMGMFNGYNPGNPFGMGGLFPGGQQPPQYSGGRRGRGR